MRSKNSHEDLGRSLGIIYFYVPSVAKHAGEAKHHTTGTLYFLQHACSDHHVRSSYLEPARFVMAELIIESTS